MKSSPHRGNTALGGVQSFAGWHALHGVGLWQALFGWPPFLTSDNEYYVNYRGENILDASEVKWDDKPTEASEPMTLCIAASFYNPVEELPGIVLCCDERGTRGLVSADDSDKVRWSPDERMAVLLAGSRTAADQLYLAIMEAIQGQADLSDEVKITKLIQLVKRAAQKRKRELMEEHVSLTLGMSLEEFTSKSRSVLLETHYLEVWHDLKTITLGAELILAALAGQEAILLRVTPSGDVLWENHFSTIGTGGPIAEAFLVQKDYDDSMGVEECVYRVYEAKVAAEKNRDVGPTTYLEVMDADSDGLNVDRLVLSDKAFAAIDRAVRNRLRTMPRMPKFEGMFLNLERSSLESSDDEPSVDKADPPKQVDNGTK